MILIGLDTDNDGQPDGVWILQNSWDDTKYTEYYVAYTSAIPGLYGVKTVEEKDWDNVYNLSNYPIIKHSGVEIGQINTQLDYIPDIAFEYYDYDVNYTVEGSLVCTYNRPKNKSEKIKAINFSSASQNSKFKISISDDGSEENYKFIKELKTDMPGIYTVDVQDIVLNSEKFSVKIETDDGALYQIINVFCDDYELYDNVKETNSYIDKGMLNSENMFEYHVTSNICDIEDGEIISYKCDSRIVNVSSTIVRNNQAIGIVKLPSDTWVNSEFNIDIMHNDEVIDTIKFAHIPEFPDSSIKGSGISDDPYVITNASQLSMISYLPAAYYVLGNDIDLKLDSKNEAAFNKGVGWVPIENFYGKLDGNGYSIKNMCINSTVLEDVSQQKCVGLFENLTYAEICNLTIENAKIVSNDGKKSSVGILAGKANSPRIKNVQISGTIDCEINKEKEANCGLLIGDLDMGGNTWYSMICNISCQGDIVSKGYTNVGGLIGKYTGTNGAYLDNFLIVTNVLSSFNENASVGEIFGEGNITNIKNSYIIPSVNSKNTDIFSGAHEDEYNVRINNAVIYKNNEADTLDKIKEDQYSNFIYSDNIEELKNISLEESGLSSDIWEYIQGNPYPTLKNQEIKFISDIVVPSELNLNKGESKKIEVSIQDEDSTFKKLQYKSSNTNIVEVDQYGNLTAKNANGMVVITVSTCDGSNITKEVKVTVGEGIDPYKINTYDSDEESKIISNIFPTTIEHYKENVNIQAPYIIKVFKNNEEITEGNIATGMITKIFQNEEIIAEYVNIVPGDVYADGIVNSRDAGMVVQYLVGMLDNLFETPQYYAMDFTRDGKIRLNDVELIKQYVVHIYEPSEEDYYGENN